MESGNTEGYIQRRPTSLHDRLFAAIPNLNGNGVFVSDRWPDADPMELPTGCPLLPLRLRRGALQNSKAGQKHIPEKITSYKMPHIHWQPLKTKEVNKEGQHNE